ncbi:MAG: hypothetical protein ABSE53_04085 [Terracidiphilus sp.]|jgi:hypothetical protein
MLLEPHPASYGLLGDAQESFSDFLPSACFDQPAGSELLSGATESAQPGWQGLTQGFSIQIEFGGFL